MLIYPRHRFKGPGMVKVLFNLREFIEVLIYPRHGSEGPGMAEVLFNP